MSAVIKRSWKANEKQTRKGGLRGLPVRVVTRTAGLAAGVSGERAEVWMGGRWPPCRMEVQGVLSCWPGGFVLLPGLKKMRSGLQGPVLASASDH